MTVQAKPDQNRWRIAARTSSALAFVAAVALLVGVVAAAALPLFGYRARIVYGGSMAPAISRGALIVEQSASPTSLEVGDVITYRASASAAPVTHRIVAIRRVDAQTRFTMKGDANGSPDPGEMNFTKDVERVTLQLPYAGFIIGFFRSLQGLALLVVLPAILLALIHVLGIETREQDAIRT